jgi:hypothetical protein
MLCSASLPALPWTSSTLPLKRINNLLSAVSDGTSHTLPHTKCHSVPVRISGTSPRVSYADNITLIFVGTSLFNYQIRCCYFILLTYMFVGVFHFNSKFHCRICTGISLRGGKNLMALSVYCNTTLPLLALLSYLMHGYHMGRHSMPNSILQIKSSLSACTLIYGS